MTNRMEEKEFDLWLTQSTPETLPDDMAERITPWKKAMSRVWIGFVMTTLLLDVFFLDMILPAVGYILSLWGFGAVRRENKWFRACGILTAGRGVFFLVKTLLPMEVFRQMLFMHGWFLAAAGAYTYSVFPVLFCLWQGQRAVRKKAGLSARSAAVPVLMLWYLLLYLLQMCAGYIGLLLPVGLLVVYMLALEGVRKALRELEKAGYAMEARAPEVPNAVSGLCVIGLVLAAWAGRNLFF